MTLYVLSPRAQVDIEEIWGYTVKHWGVPQAERYTRLIQAEIEEIASDPSRGRSCEEIRAGYRKVQVGSHMLFYRITDRAIHIVRILHERMDFERHLWALQRPPLVGGVLNSASAPPVAPLGNSSSKYRSY